MQDKFVTPNRDYFRIVRLYLFCFSAVLVFVSSSPLMFAQSINLSDSLRNILKYKPAPVFKFDSRNSFIAGRSARIQGIKLGVSFNKTLSLGIGYNWLGQGFTERMVVNNTIVEVELKMRYIAPYIEYSFYKKGPWEVAVPVQLGFGKSFLQYKNGEQKNIFSKGRIILYEPVMTVEYKILNLVGLGVGLGYRVMLKNNRAIDHRLTSPIYVLRARIIFDEIVKKTKAKYAAQP